MPSDAEFTTMENCVQIMKPLVDSTEASGAEQGLTISTIRPLLHKLLNVILTSKPTDTRQLKAIKSAMNSNLKPHYTGELPLMLSKAALEQQLRKRQLLYKNPLTVNKMKHKYNHHLQNELKESKTA